MSTLNEDSRFEVVVKKESDENESKVEESVCGTEDCSFVDFTKAIKVEIKTENNQHSLSTRKPLPMGKSEEIIILEFSSDTEDEKVVCVNDEETQGSCQNLPFNQTLYSNPQNQKSNTSSLSVLEPYSCGTCKFKTEYSNAFTRHLNKHTKQSKTSPQNKPSSPKKYKLKSPKNLTLKLIEPVCQDEPNTSRRVEEDPPVSYKCPFCDCKTSSKHSMLNHYKSYHRLLHSTKSTKSKTYKCTNCNYKTFRKDLLKHHRLMHKPPKIFKCDLCAFETHRKGVLGSHKEIHELVAKKTDYKATMYLF